MGKGEIARNEQFLLFPQCILPLKRTFFSFSSNLKLSSANSSSFEESKICRLGQGKELNNGLKKIYAIIATSPREFMFKDAEIYSVMNFTLYQLPDKFELIHTEQGSSITLTIPAFTDRPSGKKKKFGKKKNWKKKKKNWKKKKKNCCTRAISLFYTRYFTISETNSKNLELHILLSANAFKINEYVVIFEW